MVNRKFPSGFVLPAQPVEAIRPPAGPQWVHEIKHDGYRLIVRRHGATVRLWTRRAVDYTDRFPAIAAAAGRLTANSFTIDGEATVIGARTVWRSSTSSAGGRAPARPSCTHSTSSITTARIFATAPSSSARPALARLLHGSKTAILLNEHIAEDGAVVFAHACKLGAEGIVSKRVDAPYRSGPHGAWVKVRNPASIAVQRERSENWNK
jgi:bifunctional non-homologous end joining protein LigD